MTAETQAGCTNCNRIPALLIHTVLGLLAAVYAVLILTVILGNFTALIAYEQQALNTISMIVHGALVPLVAAIPAWVAIVACILSVIFIALWTFGGLGDAWWNNWVARWLALGNCGALPTWWQRAVCYWQTWNLIQELIGVGVAVSIFGAIAAVNIAALG